MQMTPVSPVLFLVIRDHGAGFGIGSTDITESRDMAYDNFACAVDDGDPVAVWQIATHAGLPCGIKDVTDAFEREQQDVCIARGMDWPVVRRIEDAPVMALAAE